MEYSNVRLSNVEVQVSQVEPLTEQVKRFTLVQPMANRCLRSPEEVTSLCR